MLIGQRRLGVIISYITLIFTSIVGVLFTPLLISSLGKAEYGLYQLVNSFAGYLVILNFGTGTVVTRYIAKYRSLNNHKEQQNFLSMALIITFIFSFLVIIVGTGLFFSIDIMFKSSLTVNEISKAKQLFVLMMLNIALSFFTNYFSGITSGYEKFGIANGFKLLRMIIKYSILWILLKLGLKSVALVSLDLGITILILLLESSYCFNRLKVRIKYYYIDRKLLTSVGTFSFAVFLQAIVNQVNQNIDRVILGILTDTNTVAIYSISLVVYSMFNNITGTIGGVFVPQATKMITEGATSEELTDLVIKPGRIQFIIGGAIGAGFILFGKNFIKIWVGEDFLGAYLPTLFLIIPSIIPMMQNVANTILDALMKRLGRSLILIFMSLMNIVLTLVFVNVMGYVGAAIATGISIFIGNIILMNIYYKRTFGLNVLRMFKSIFNGILPCLMVATLISVPITIILDDTILNFIIKGFIFVSVYLGLLIRFGFNQYEQNLFINPFKSIVSKVFSRVVR